MHWSSLGHGERGLTVVLVSASGTPAGRSENGSARGPFPNGFDTVLPELGTADVRIDEQRWGAFTGTSLDDDLPAASPRS